MTIRDFFLNVGTFILPRTPAGALKAFEGGFAPIEAFIYKSTSSKPIDEQPYDLDEIERILSRPNLDFKTNVVLMGIFEKLIHHEDQELALFAAEGINVIENRYNARISALKKEITEADSPLERLSDLGRLYFELALLNIKRKTIKEFYIDQSIHYFQELLQFRTLTENERNTYIRSLMEVRDYQTATELLEKNNVPKSAKNILLLAEIEYSQKKFDRASELISRLIRHMDELNEREMVLYAYWMGA